MVAEPIEARQPTVPEPAEAFAEVVLANSFTKKPAMQAGFPKSGFWLQEPVGRANGQTQVLNIRGIRIAIFFVIFRKRGEAQHQAEIDI